MKLNDGNFILFAAKNYENQNCENIDEFYNDLLIPVRLKKLLTRYHVSGVLKERLIINHIISLFNVFPVHAAVKILFFKIDKKYYPYLKTFLIYLERCPDAINGIGDTTIYMDDIPINTVILNKLQKK
jgi:hypothetical protein